MQFERTPQCLPQNAASSQAAAASASPPKESAIEARNFPIIVHSHLSWHWVWQRPQQFLSRLSRSHRVLFIETHAPDDRLLSPLAQCQVAETHANITVLKIQFPARRWHEADYVDQERRRLVQAALSGPLRGQFHGAVQWFYDPMAVTAFAGRLGERAIVYDCMDELAKFRGAPPALLEREAELLALADVVFTGGWRLYEAKSRLNANCHFYGCGVDLEHFGKARRPDTALPEDLRRLPRPVLGFFGVVDERMDYELVARLADATPKGSVVIVGPAAKVEADQFPRRSNLHWLGQRNYSELPHYAKGFDVCLMPFALNESTEYINPTKALEYLAAGRPVVSTAIADVMRNFGAVVTVGHSHSQFIELCHRSLEQPEPQLIERGLALAAQNTWDSIVQKLETHAWEALQARRQRQPAGGIRGKSPRRRKRPGERPAPKAALLAAPLDRNHYSTKRSAMAYQ